MIEGADHLYKEIRIDNALTNTSGQEVHLKSGAKVEVMIKAQTLSCLKNFGRLLKFGAPRRQESRNRPLT